MFRRFAFFVWICAVAPAAAAVTNRSDLQRQFQRALAVTPGALWGVQVVALRTGTTWFETNAAARLTPASNTKLFTAALALDRLGADHRFATSLRVTAQASPDAAGRLRSDLLIVGDGDPTFCGRLHGGSWEQAFAPLVKAVQQAGIRQLDGDLVCDESRFRGPPYGSGWNWDDLAQDYGAATSALSAEDNVLAVVLTPGTAVGAAATGRFQPLTHALTLELAVTTGPAGSPANLELARLPGETRLQVSGRIPLGGKPVVTEASVPGPAKWFGDLFREALQRAGVTVTGQIRVITAADRRREPLDATRWRELAAIPSPPVGEIVREMMKPSQNLYAQLLLLGVGAETERHPRDDERGAPTATTEEAGVRALERWVEHVGIEPADVRLEEGSGLSRKNLVTPRATVRLLQFMTTHRWAQAWWAALPIGGVDGSLQNRFTQAPAKGNVRAKTGTLRHVNALSGYVTNAAGEPLVFSFLVNNYVTTSPTTTARAELDALVELLARSEIREP